jgi:hypothetical protein
VKDISPGLWSRTKAEKTPGKTVEIRKPSMERYEGSEIVRKEFESNLARSITGQKKETRILGKAWISVALCAVLLAGSALAVTAQWTGGENGAGVDNGIQDQIRDPESSPDCTCDCDGICDNDADGDGVCDNKEDCTCPN